MKPASKPTVTTVPKPPVPFVLAALPALARETVRLIPVNKIHPSRTQPRKEFPAEEMAELREHIQANGIQIPLLGRSGTFAGGIIELVAGERRWRCAKELKLAHVPMIVREMKDQEMIRIQRAENAGRENLKALEAAEDYLMLQKAGKSVDEIAALHGGKRSHIYTRLRVAKLPDSLKAMVRSGKLQITIADLIAKLPTAESQVKAAKEVTTDNWDGPMSFREAQELLDDDYARQLIKAPWKLADAELVKSAGPCSACPKRSGNLPGAEGNPNVCTDVKCYEGKQTAHTMTVLNAAKAEGRRIIPSEQYQKHSYHYAQSDEKCYQDSKQRTWTQLAAAAKVEPAVTVDSAGAAVKVFSKEDKAKILTANKINHSSHSPNAGPSKADKEERAQEQTAIECATTKAGLEAANDYPKLPDAFWRRLAHTVINAQEYVLSARHWTGRALAYTNDHEKDMDTLHKYVDGAIVQNLVAMIVQMLVAEQVSVTEVGALTVWGVDWRQFLPKDTKTNPAAVKPGQARKGAK